MVVQGGVFAFEVVVAEVTVDFGAGTLAVFVFGDFQLRLDGSEAAFQKCVVIAVAGAAHALQDAVTTQHPAIFLAGVLSATIGVMEEAKAHCT